MLSRHDARDDTNLPEPIALISLLTASTATVCANSTTPLLTLTIETVPLPEPIGHDPDAHAVIC